MKDLPPYVILSCKVTLNQLITSHILDPNIKTESNKSKPSHISNIVTSIPLPNYIYYKNISFTKNSPTASLGSIVHAAATYDGSNQDDEEVF